MNVFDEHFPPAERLPRLLRAEFTTEPGPYGQVVHLTVNGAKTGDPLTDRGWSETGYRWHDALHLAHAVCLGWSPVLRGLAGLRRRSNPHTDHIEDGGRAVVAEEAIAWALFCYARTHDWMPDGPPAVLLDRVEEMSYGLEVARCTRPQWRHAFTIGIDCLRALWHHQGGTLTGDLEAECLEFCPPSPANITRASPSTDTMDMDDQLCGTTSPACTPASLPTSTNRPSS